MDITRNDALFPYIEGDFLVGRADVVLTIASIQIEEMPDHKGRLIEKVTISFAETAKRLVLNKTNCKVLIRLYGKETDDWQGKRIAVYSEKVKAFGQEHNAVRIRDGIPERNGRKSVNDVPMPEAVPIQTMTEDMPPDQWGRELDAAYSG